MVCIHKKTIPITLEIVFLIYHLFVAFQKDFSDEGTT